MKQSCMICNKRAPHQGSLSASGLLIRAPHQGSSSGLLIRAPRQRQGSSTSGLVASKSKLKIEGEVKNQKRAHPKHKKKQADEGSRTSQPTDLSCHIIINSEFNDGRTCSLNHFFCVDFISELDSK